MSVYKVIKFWLKIAHKSFWPYTLNKFNAFLSPQQLTRDKDLDCAQKMFFEQSKKTLTTNLTSLL